MTAIRQFAAACQYAAQKHADQRRKGADAAPYVNHVIEVAWRVTQSPQSDATVAIAALLHDILEDTDGTAEEIADLFGKETLGLVREVTDDKSLPKERRKQLQIETAATKSDGAKRIKLADMASNVASFQTSPPEGWPVQRIVDYLAWAEAVAAGCRGVDDTLEAAFDAAVASVRAHLATEERRG